MILPRLSLIFPALLMASAACAQTPAQEPPPVVGGYQTAPVDDPDIKAAADFAVSAAPKPYTLTEIVTARQQVVAGINYSLCLRVKTKKVGLFTHGRFVAAKIFRDLNQTYQLTAWQDMKTCG